jgi:hypothetical protein
VRAIHKNAGFTPCVKPFFGVSESRADLHCFDWLAWSVGVFSDFQKYL